MKNNSESAWILDENKCLELSEIKKLKEKMQVIKEQVSANGSMAAKRSAYYQWFLIELGAGTGMRVMEMANLHCGDFAIEGNRCSLVVRKGKCGKSRLIKFSSELKSAIEKFLAVKKKIGEPVSEDAPVFFSRRKNDCMTTRALQKIFKRALRLARIRPGKYGIHSMRHTYATFLLKASKYNLRLVQQQLGHASIRITQTYLSVLNPDLEKALKGLYKN